MATIKSYTDIEQSRKLAKILPLESADMEYLAIKENGLLIAKIPFVKDDSEVEDSAYSHIYDRIVCWSLATLRNLLPPAIKPNKDLYLFESHNTFNNSWVYRYYNEDDTSYLYYNNTSEIDVCYEMILKLHELNLL